MLGCFGLNTCGQLLRFLLGVGPGGIWAQAAGAVLSPVLPCPPADTPRVHGTINMLIEVHAWIRSHLPYWDRNGGRDHIIVSWRWLWWWWWWGVRLCVCVCVVVLVLAWDNEVGGVDCGGMGWDAWLASGSEAEGRARAPDGGGAPDHQVGPPAGGFPGRGSPLTLAHLRAGLE